MVLSCSRFMADASHLRRMKLTVDRRMKHSMLSMIVTGLPITQELAQEKQLAWPSAPGNQTDERKCCKWSRCHIHLQVWTYAMETDNMIFQMYWESENGKTKKKMRKPKKNKKKSTGLETQKVGKPKKFEKTSKTKKTSRKQKKTKKNNFPEVLVDRGSSQEFPNIVFLFFFCFFLFSRGFFGFLPKRPKTSRKPKKTKKTKKTIFQRSWWIGGPAKSSQILFFLFFLFFLVFSRYFCFFWTFSIGLLSKEYLSIVFLFFFLNFLHEAFPQRVTIWTRQWGEADYSSKKTPKKYFLKICLKHCKYQWKMKKYRFFLGGTIYIYIYICM